MAVYNPAARDRVNFSQVTPYPSPILPNYELTISTSLPLYPILACEGIEVGIRGYLLLLLNFCEPHTAILLS